MYPRSRYRISRKKKDKKVISILSSTYKTHDNQKYTIKEQIETASFLFPGAEIRNISLLSIFYFGYRVFLEIIISY
ncbi:MAG: hypothetical protein A2293_13975 [Elusimicrobia bacterium RIFOXYB2_FULL_49_7]|nr:MAG: hypothetical protein A2293_13975 [Elusimicrobia bacterium RIFOXYB2_FULL_49_7]